MNSDYISKPEYNHAKMIIDSAELSQLRAQAAQAEALKRAVNEAREIISGMEFCSNEKCESCNRVRAWLAAHPLTRAGAPAQQEQAG